MPFRVTCPACQTPSVVPDEAVGRKARCKRCSNVFQLPSARPKSPVADEASRLEEVADPPSDGLQTAPKSRPSAKKHAAARPSVRSVKRAAPPRSSAAFWIVGAVATLLLLGGGMALALVLANKDKDEEKTTLTANAAEANKDKGDTGANKPAPGGDPKPTDVKPEDRIPVAENDFQDSLPKGEGPRGEVPQAKVPPPPQATGDGSKPPEGWSEYSPQLRTFSVWLPNNGGRRSERNRTLRVRRSTPLRMTLVQLERNDGAIYSAGVIAVPLSLLRGIPLRQRVEFFRDAYVELYKGKIEKEASVKQGAIGAKEYTITTGRGRIRMRLFLLGTRLYQAFVEGSEEQAQSQDATTFLDSFRLPTRQPGTPLPTGVPFPPTGTPPATNDILAGKGATVLPGEPFGFLQSAVKDKRLADTAIKGFTLTNKVYRDACADGGVLIGLQVGLKKFFNKDVVASLRPIYLTKNGEKMGDWIGPKPANPVTVKAKPGYVVGGLTIRTGLGIDGFSLEFVKWDKDHLQVQDHSKSAWVGNETGGSPSALAVQGYFFVGITGHLGGENTPCSLGLIAVLRPKD